MFANQSVLRLKFNKALVSVLLCAALCVVMAACGSDGEETASGAQDNVSSQAENENLTELEKLVQEDQFQEQVKALSETYEAKGIKLEVVAEGDTVVYKCIYTVQIDAEKSKDELAEHLESKSFETSIDSVLRSFKAQVPQTRAIVVRYIDMNGSIIASREYK